MSVTNFAVPQHLGHLYAHLRDNGFLEALEAPPDIDLSVMPQRVLALIQAGDPAWERLVPPEVVGVIKAKGLFGLPA